jgi:regulator of sirC expression with transglutaminase-like and TPR domain
MGLLVSKLEYPELDVDLKLREFQVLVDNLKSKLPRDLTVADQTQFIVKYFAGELDFSGDQSNYYNFKNSLLSDVLLRRKGIPVSLSLVFMGLCRGVGLKAVGINFPGHFLVQIHANDWRISSPKSMEVASEWTKTWFVDCFDKGKFLGVEDCERRLKEWTRGVIPFTPDVLKVSKPEEIISRMLRNLKAIFGEKEDYPRLYWVLSALVAVCPADRSESYRERGLLMARMGRYKMATYDLKKFLENPSDPKKVDHVQRLIRQFESQIEVIN